jgi:hypothetical protein
MGNTCFPGLKTVNESNQAQALLVWDIENIRLPKEITPLNVLFAIKQRFIKDSGYTEHKSICCVTHVSLRAIEKQWPAFLSDVVPHMDVELAPARRAKCDADYVLRREMSRFCHAFASSAKKKIVLLTGDADFVEPIQAAHRSGCDVHLIYNATNASRFITTTQSTFGSCEWAGFLKDVNDGIDVTLPYDEPSPTLTPLPTTQVVSSMLASLPAIMGKNATKKAKRKAASKERKIVMKTRDGVVIRSHWIDVRDEEFIN